MSDAGGAGIMGGQVLLTLSHSPQLVTSLTQAEIENTSSNDEPNSVGLIPHSVDGEPMVCV